MPGVADFVERISHGGLAVRLESNVKVNRSIGRRVTKGLPVGWDDMPRVLYPHIVPT